MPERLAPLSPRHWEVLALVAQGLANKEIAAELGIGVETVKGHLRTILRRLGLPNRAAAARWYADSVNTAHD